VLTVNDSMPWSAGHLGGFTEEFMQDGSWLCELLKPYGISLVSDQTAQILSYLSLLTQWNQHVNLVSAASLEVWVRRHFVESLYLSRAVVLEGRLIDIGSGAGFPALPLKIIFPRLKVTLLEPIGKKRAFLKEVCRACDLGDVEVRSERIEEFDPGNSIYNIATSRAVGHFQMLVPRMIEFLEEGGWVFLWVSARQEAEIPSASKSVVWKEPIRIPATEGSQICWGIRKSPPSPGESSG